jgi:phosphate starvation-inducible protein PhoH and related proteins
VDRTKAIAVASNGEFMADELYTVPQDFDFFDPIDDDGRTKSTKRTAKKADKEVRQRGRSPRLPVTPRTETQARYIESMETNELTFGVGPAGVGKTYVAARVLGAWLYQRRITKIYAARPNVSKNKHRNGFLPGDIEEKTEPWLVPIYEGLRDALGSRAFEDALRDNLIEVVPFEYIQGRTFRAEEGSNLGVGCIVDEAENLDLDDLYITLTRQGTGLTMVMCGDINQARIPDSGLGAVIEMACQDKHESTGVVVFTEADVVRSRQAAQWVKSFAKRRHSLGLYKVTVNTESLQNLTGAVNIAPANTIGELPFLRAVA